MRSYKQTGANSDGLYVVTGKVKSISEDRTVMVIESSEYVKDEKKEVPFDLELSNPVGFDADTFKKGFNVTAVGYQLGNQKKMAPGATVLSGTDVFSTEKTAVISGFVKFARLNEEKNADGTQKTKADGTTPKKPHFDITIVVKDNDTGRWVNHVIQIYNSKFDDKAIEKAQKLYGNFNPETEYIKGTWVTGNGQEWNYESTGKDGKSYVNYMCSHLGVRMADVEREAKKEREQSQNGVTTPAPVQVPEPIQNSGFSAPDMDMDMGENDFQ